MGATETLSHLRKVGRSLHAWVVPAEVSIGDSDGAFDFRGTLSTTRWANGSGRSVGKLLTSPDYTSARIICSSLRNGKRSRERRSRSQAQVVPGFDSRGAGAEESPSPRPDEPYP